MTLQKELKHILRIEKDGRQLLEEARREADEIVRDHRTRARKAREDQEAQLAEWERNRRRENEEKVANEVATREKRTEDRRKRLRATAEKSREEAIRKVLGWLWEGE